MPYITQPERDRFTTHLVALANAWREAGKKKGQLVYILTELAFSCVGEVSFDVLSERLDALQCAHDEARRVTLDIYEAFASTKRGNTPGLAAVRNKIYAKFFSDAER